MKKVLVALALIASVAGGGRALAQTATTPAAPATQATDTGITPNGVIGEVAAVDMSAKQLFVKTNAGSVVVVGVADSTTYMRLPPGESSLTKATKSTFAEISAGDRVFARGKVADDRKAMVARMLIINTKADIEKKQEADRAEWKRRGIVGVVSALNPATKEITLQARGPEAKPVIIPTTGTVKLRRYAPDSVKFSEAKPSTFEELKVGDQLRAKGDKSEDGTRFNAEEVVTGSFRTVVGTITGVDAATNQIKINTLQGNQPVTVVVSRDSMLKMIPADFAAMMMQRAAGGGAPGAPGAATPAQGGAGTRPPAATTAGQGSTTPPATAGGPAAGGPPAGGGMRRMGDMQEMMDRLPPTSVAELKPGSMVVFSTTGTDPTRVTAIQLVAGIEPLVAMMSGRPGGGRGPGGGGGAGAGGGAGFAGFGFGIGQP
ncbi:MAG TPA: hypothetical protein VNA19_08790 [Pyrinomonadaceae bacterium]|jgi:hypothetical protein|nr:hypothetical protein [Pyrinomonadaceae bacterium]